MTETAMQTSKPILAHAGKYWLFETPDGGRHLIYQRTSATNEETGEVQAIDGAPEQHLPDFPAAALPLIDKVISEGLPPQVVALMGAVAGGAGMSKIALAKAVAGLGLGGGDDAG
jgi:hypothetical protein